jgi:methylglutaconyl-CoA hydratase
MTDLPPDGEPTAFTNAIAEPLVENAIVDDVGSYVDIDATPDGIVTVTITRSEKRNAFNAEVIAALSQTFETLQGSDGVRVVFLRGAGGSFCAGADLEWMRAAVDYSEGENRQDAMDLATMLKNLSEIPALTVALVEGAAMGGGAGLAAVCDYAVATADARFAFSEVKLGLIPAAISPYVVNAIGPRAARPLFVTGRVFDAAYAEKIGLVHEVAADAAALESAKERIAREALLAAPLAAAEARRLIWDVWGREIDHGLMEETARRIARIRVSPEGQEGVRAFLERRKPSWLD